MTSPDRSPPALALGCAKIGSALTPLSERDTIALLQRAHELGIRDFDTASIYGQGDSERFIGRALGAHRHALRIATKGGQLLSAKQAFLARFKGPIRFLAARTGRIKQGVADARGHGVPKCFEAAYIARALEGSLLRLGTRHVDTYYLHSPPVAALADPALKGVLRRARASGRARQIGVSCDDLDLALAAATDPDIDVVQFALSADPRCLQVLDTLAAQGKRAVVRGLLNASSDPGAASQGLAERIAASVAHPAVGVVILGTTDIGHLAENVRAFEAATRTRLKDAA